jgi:response regulator RpfG family c-di-GMP phosphodiesterase
VSQRVLFVDDEPNVLEGIRRTLCRQVELQTASSGAEALRLMSGAGHFALVISDLRMPAMNGAQFLAKVRVQDPDTVRMILTDRADLAATMTAVNEGHADRFLTKPCPADRLLAAVEDGLNQHRFLTAERELLEHTLGAAAKMLIEILGMVSPAASSRAARLQRYSNELSRALGLPGRWEWGLAALLSQIGCIALPEEILFKVEACLPLTEEEKQLYESHPDVAGKLLSTIPRLEDVAAIVTAQFGSLGFAGMPSDLQQWDVRKIGQLLLRASIEYDRLVARGASCEAAVNALRASKFGFPMFVLDALLRLPIAKERIVRQIRLADLMVGMISDEDLVSLKGIRLVPSGADVTRSMIKRLTSIASGVGVAEPFRVRVAE